MKNKNKPNAKEVTLISAYLTDGEEIKTLRCEVCARIVSNGFDVLRSYAVYKHVKDLRRGLSYLCDTCYPIHNARKVSAGWSRTAYMKKKGI
jgi:hypothetical protein